MSRMSQEEQWRKAFNHALMPCSKVPGSLCFKCVVYCDRVVWCCCVCLVRGCRAPCTIATAVINIHLQTLHNRATVVAADNGASLRCVWGPWPK